MQKILRDSSLKLKKTYLFAKSVFKQKNTNIYPTSLNYLLIIYILKNCILT